MNPSDAASVTRALLDWYSEAARDLPWRRTPTPYRVLLSELMLQQTRVETVLPYFERFLQRWPTLGDLASASEEEVLHAWAGLGYYSRARHLLACARAATEAGGLPSRPEALRALPGIGPYTAGAIASIAFGVSTPVVDGNVERVLSRLDGSPLDPKRKGRRPLWERATALHQALEAGAHPGDLNQALMELGATCCTPRQPRCTACPLQARCVAHATGQTTTLPVRTPRTPPREVRAAAGLCWTEDGVVLGRRPSTGLLGGLWEPICGHPVGAEAASDRVRQSFLERACLDVEVGEPLGTVVHVFTHQRWTCEVYRVAGEGTPVSGDGYQAVRRVVDPDTVALSTLARRILALGKPCTRT